MQGFRAERGGRILVGGVDMFKLPMDVAFDVVVQRDARDLGIIGSVTGRAGQLDTKYVRGLLPSPVSTNATIVLRSSDAVARKTVDVFEIWKGELVYDNVPVDIKP